MLDSYDFDFLIVQASEILIVVLDDTNEEIHRFRGDESNPFMASLEFDETDGGGTVNLADNLPTGYTLILILAPDEPKQTSNFTTAGVFGMAYLQAAFNKLGALIQRVSWLAQRGIRLNDAFNDTFDPQLPFALENGRTIVINETGTGLQLGPTVDELIQASQDSADAEAARIAAEAAQVAAETAETNAETAETNAETAESNAAGSAVAAAASAVAAAASALAAQVAGWTSFGPQVCNENATTNLTGETTDHTTIKKKNYIFTVERGTTVFSEIQYAIVYRNGSWEGFLIGDFRNENAAESGVSFTVDATTAQIAAVVDNSGAGNATISGKHVSVAA